MATSTKSKWDLFVGINVRHPPDDREFIVRLRNAYMRPAIHVV